MVSVLRGEGDIKTSKTDTLGDLNFIRGAELIMCNLPTLMSIGQPFSCAVEPNLEMG